MYRAGEKIMLSIALYALAMVTSSAHADPGKLSKATRDSLITDLDNLRRRSQQYRCNDPFNLTLEPNSSSGISEFASFAERLGLQEMDKDLVAYRESTVAARKALKGRVGYFPGTLDDDMLALESYRLTNILPEVWDEMCRGPAAGKDCVSSKTSLVKFQDYAAELIWPFERDLEPMKVLLNDKNFPLSLKGPLENILSTSSELIEAVRDIGNQPNSGISLAARFKTKFAHLSSDVISADQFYRQKEFELEKKHRMAREMKSCPGLIDGERKILATLRDPSQSVVTADAKLQAAEAALAKALSFA
jgi:hypothetical protein